MKQCHTGRAGKVGFYLSPVINLEGNEGGRWGAVLVWNTFCCSDWNLELHLRHEITVFVYLKQRYCCLGRACNSKWKETSCIKYREKVQYSDFTALCFAHLHWFEVTFLFSCSFFFTVLTTTGKECKFPFRKGGRLHHHCITIYFSRPWWVLTRQPVWL